jgi:hypothetical protein
MYKTRNQLEERVVGRFDLVRVEHWALELAANEANEAANE